MIMEFKGTKGKWGINPKASRNVRCGGITIANCSGGQNGDNQEEEQANAKLIAAAPEMFEMLKDALNILEMSDLEGNVSFKIKDLLTKITK